MQSVDEFTPSTTEPVFGSGLVSQTKSQTSTNNDVNDNEKVTPSSEPIVNGQNDSAVNKITSNENITNGTTAEDMDAGDSSAAHVNGKEEKPTAETMDVVKSTEELTIAEEPPAEPQPVLSTPAETVTESSSAAATTAAEIIPPPVAETTASDNVPEVPVTTESETTEPKSKSPRGKVKAPVASTTPVRQSTRARKPGPSSSTNADDDDDDDMGETIAPVESSKRTKRQAATSSVAADVNDPDDDITEGKTKAVATPVTKKRGASKTTKSSDVSSESETIQTPPKKARTSATKKTPEPPTEEYVRKLRPRK